MLEFEFRDQELRKLITDGQQGNKRKWRQPGEQDTANKTRETKAKHEDDNSPK